MQGIFKIIIVSSLIGIVSGCFTDKRIPISEPVDYRARWKALAPFVMEHFDTGNKTLKEIAADLALAEYEQQKKKDDMWKEFIEVIG